MLFGNVFSFLADFLLIFLIFCLERVKFIGL